MAGNGYLKTVSFGGFDKKDVLNYIDDLTSKIYRLETELTEKNEALEKMQTSGGKAQANFKGKEELEKKLEDSKKKISELMATADTTKLELTNLMGEAEQKDADLDKLKAEVEDLKEKLSNAEANSGSSSDVSSFDIGSVFIEAKNSADKIVQEAKKAAKKMESEAKDLQNQMLDEANAQAERIVVDANKEAETIVTTAKSTSEAMISASKAEAASILDKAKTEASTIREKSSSLRSSVKSEFTNLDSNMKKLTDVLNALFGDSLIKADTAKGLIGEGLKLVEDNKDFNGRSKGSDAENLVDVTPKKEQLTEKSSPKSTGGFRQPEPKPMAEQAKAASVEPVKAKQPEPVQKAVTVPEKDPELSEVRFRDIGSKEEPQPADPKPEQPKKQQIPKVNPVDADIMAKLTEKLQEGNQTEDDGISDEDFLVKWK